LQIFVDNISPILVIAAVGFLLGKRLEIDPRPLGRVIFYVFSPSLIFNSLANNSVAASELAQIALVLVLFVSVMTVISYWLTWRIKEQRLERAGIVLSAICPNSGNFGVPLIGFAFGEDVLARAVLAFVIITAMNYTIGVFVASSGRQTILQACVSVLKVPTAYAALAGFLVTGLGIDLPNVVSRPVGLMAQAAVPGMLILLGLQLAQATDLSHFRFVGAGAALRLLLAPLVAVILLGLFHVSGPALPALILQMSMPVAVVTIIFATEFGLDVKLTSSTVLASTILSPITLSILILLLRWHGQGPIW
jgi:predicted permease